MRDIYKIIHTLILLQLHHIKYREGQKEGPKSYYIETAGRGKCLNEETKSESAKKILQNNKARVDQSSESMPSSKHHPLRMYLIILLKIIWLIKIIFHSSKLQYWSNLLKFSSLSNNFNPGV